MDKENSGSGNINDILKLLKDTVENTPSAENTDTVDSEVQAAENMDAELLKETLRSKFMSDDSDALEMPEQSDEYAIDESFVSEVEDSIEEEPEKEIEEISEEEMLNVGEDYYTDSEEVDNSNTNGIIEIAIPWVDSISEASPRESGLLYEDEDIEDEEGGFVMFADGEYSDDTDDYDGMEEEEESEEQVEESVDLMTESAEENAEAEEIADDSDDVPWFDTTDCNFSEEGVAVFLSGEPTEEPEKIVEESLEEVSEVSEEKSEEVFDVPEEIVYDSAEDSEEFEEDDLLVEDEYAEYEDNAESLEDLEAIDGIVLSVTESEHIENIEKVDNAEDVEVAPLEAVDLNEGECDDDGESFYRTMVEANALRQQEYANNFANISDVEASENEYEAFGIPEEEIDMLAELDVGMFDKDNYVGNSEMLDSITKEDVYADFYSLKENDVPTETNEHHDKPVSEPQVEIEEDDEIEGAFASFVKSSFWRIARPVLLSILGLLVFILEILPLANVVPDGILDYSTYPWLYILLDIQLMVFMIALCFKDIKEGTINLFSRTPRLWSVLSATVIATLLHSVVAIFCAKETLPNLYNSISALYLIVATVFGILDQKRIEHSIDVLSTEKEKIFALKHSSGPNSCAEKMYRGGMDPDTDIFEPVQVGKKNCRGVFARESRYFDNRFFSSAIVPIAVFSIFIFVISIVLEIGLVVTVNTVIYVFLLLAPLSAIVAHNLPLLLAYLRLRQRDCFIAGYASAKDIAECDIIVFNDKHLFCDCEPRNAGIKLYCEEHKTKELFTCLAAVFSSVGGPMENTFGEVIKNEKHKVSMVRITRNGFEAVVDAKTSIIVGSSEYLARYGIRTDGADTRESGIVYVAMNSILSAKLSLSYETQPLFEELCELLGDNGINTVIQTYDPIITGKYVVKRRRNNKYPISVVHKNANDYNTPMSEKVVGGKTGAFALSSRLKLVELAIFAKSLARIVRINSIIRVILYALGGAIGIVTLLLGLSAHVNMLWVLMYQILAAGVFVYTAMTCLPISFEQIMEKRKRDQLRKQEREIND